MDISLFIRHRLKELNLDQKDLAEAVQVTDSYISQLLARKKLPPAPSRTDLYERIGNYLKLPAGELARLATEQRQQELRRKVLDVPSALLKDFRELILRKCAVGNQAEVRRIFEKEAFGELERLVTQKILDVVQGIVREQLSSEDGLRAVAGLRGLSYEQMRVAVLEFLDTDVLAVSSESCTSFLDPMVESWGIDLHTFSLEIALNPSVASRATRRFEFLEKIQKPPLELGFKQFLQDATLSGGAAKEEIEFLGALRFQDGKRPVPLYYYRELQNLRDPLHFLEGRPT